MRQKGKKLKTKRAIILYDPREVSFTVIDHNLGEAEAAEQAGRYRAQGINAYTIPQTRTHINSAADCVACARRAQAMIQRLGGTIDVGGTIRTGDEERKVGTPRRPGP